MKKKFYEKFQSKSDFELQEIIENEKNYQKEAVSLAKEILFQRTNSSGKELKQTEKDVISLKIEKSSHDLKHSLEQKKGLKSSYKKKSIAIFIEYFLFSFLFQLAFEIFQSNSEDYEFNDFFKIYFICFFTYYSGSAMIFKGTFIMRLFGIELVNLNNLNFKVIIYSLASILDRTIFAPFHLLLAFLNYEKLLFCEKVSGIRWETINE